MSSAAITALLAAERALITALDADDVEGIAAGTAELADAIVRVRAQPNWAATEELRRQIEEARTLADAARVRLNVLVDLTGRRLQRLVGLTGRAGSAATYGRTGRIGS